ncbi:hypothetical protein CO709_28320 [Burkholderia thailandensis]|nr:hypothetical protein CO709_28320 [Burkholderia thailandensis]KWZ56090.1 hypothetical protein WS92_09370 [Burkholderia sp. MSMB1588]
MLSAGNTCAVKSADRSLKPESAYARIKNVDKTHLSL